MDSYAKRFARRVLLAHLLALAVVLVLIAFASREIYDSTANQILTQAKSRQALLANVTAQGIESYYQFIINNLDLLRRAENEEGPAPTTRSVESAITERAITVANRGSLLGPVLWKQLEGRVSLLFSVDRDRLNAGNAPIRVIGTSDPALVPETIVARTHEWLESVQTPAISSIQRFGSIGVNLVCIPFPRGRLLIAVVPIHQVEDLFLKSFQEDSEAAAWVVNEHHTALAASRSPLVGADMTSIANSAIQKISADNDPQGQTEEIAQPFVLGTTRFGPSLVSVEPITVGGKTWQLFISTSMGQVNAIISHLFHRAVLWGIFVVVSITAILVSTAVQLIASRMRLERERHELLTRELNQAREIQLAWLPVAQPSAGAIDIAAVNNPASHISGDFYNWFEFPDGRLVVTIGDVTGHGMAAAFLMATTQLLVRNTMVRLGDAGRCLQEVNRQLCVQIFNGQFVTMLILILDIAQGQMEVATAGHPPPLIGDGKTFHPLTLNPNLVLGVERETTFATERFSLPAGASLLLYTDGAIDCINQNGARFNIESLRRTLIGTNGNAQNILDKVLKELDTFRGHRELDDDLTLVAIHLQSAPAAAPLVAASA